MHFYTYDEWLNNSYYSIDEDEIGINGSKTYKLTTSGSSRDKYLLVKSSWSSPKFVSTYTKGAPCIIPETPTIDCDLGCLYQMQPSYTDDDELKVKKYYLENPETYRKERGCIQYLDDARGNSTLTSFPYMYLKDDVLSGDDNKNPETLVINLDKYKEFDRIIIFQSIYSGAISFEEARTKLEFQFVSANYNPIVQDNIESFNEKYTIDTNLYSSSSIMIVGALITFDNIGDSTYVVIDNISKFVYGHVDMDDEYNWNILWKTFVPSSDSSPLESSIMHYQKKW